MLEEIVEKVLHCFNGKSSAGLRNACENYRTTGDEPQKLGRHAAAVWLLMRTLIDVEQENENLKQEVLNLKQGHGAPATQSAEGAKRGDVEAKSTEQMCTAVQMSEEVWPETSMQDIRVLKCGPAAVHIPAKVYRFQHQNHLLISGFTGMETSRMNFLMEIKSRNGQETVQRLY